MAAGLGFKTFTTGEVLSAANVNGYLMQGVLVFASAAARDAAITSPQEGQFAYLKDTNVTTYYTGSAWANLDTTGMTNPMTTTGDTIYSSSGSTPARLGIGTAGQVLQVNSGATAPQWATPSSGAAPLLIPINSGKYIKGFQIAALNQAGITANTTFYIPIYLAGTTYDRISFLTGASQSGSTTVRMGIYNVGANNKPTTLVLDAGTVSANAASTVFEITINQALSAGYYYLAINAQGGATGYGMYISDPVIPTGGYSSSMSNQYINSQTYYQSGVTGAFADAGTLVTDNTQFFMGMRIA